MKLDSWAELGDATTSAARLVEIVAEMEETLHATKTVDAETDFAISKLLARDWRLMESNVLEVVQRFIVKLVLLQVRMRNWTLDPVLLNYGGPLKFK